MRGPRLERAGDSECASAPLPLVVLDASVNRPVEPSRLSGETDRRGLLGSGRWLEWDILKLGPFVRPGLELEFLD